MSLEEFNDLHREEAFAQLLRCCGAEAWAKGLNDGRPYANIDELLAKAVSIWESGTRSDWLQAFAQHPKIGDIDSLKKRFQASKTWAENEQAEVDLADEKVLSELAEFNRQYLNRFGYIFIVFATGKTAGQMLEYLKNRIDNSPQEELKIAAGEQLKITKLRLHKLLDLAE